MQERTSTLWLVRLLLALGICGSAAPAGSAPFARILTIALEGEPALGRAHTYKMLYSGPRLNNRGDVGFAASIDDGVPNYGAYARFSDGGFDAVFSDDPPPPGLAAPIGSFSAPVVNDARSFVTFGGNPPINPLAWLRKRDTLEVLLKVGDPVPGLPGVTYDENPTGFDFNDAGQLLLGTALSDGSRGLFRIDDSGTTIVAADGDTAPVLGDPVFTRIGESIDLNDAGDAVFTAMTDAATNRRGLFSWFDGTLGLVARDGQPVPGRPDRSIYFYPGEPERPSLSNAGTIAFGAGTLPCCFHEGLFLLEGGTLSTLVLDGDPVPDRPGRVFDYVGGARINSAGTIVFEAAYLDEADEWMDGIYVMRDGAIANLLERGDPIPQVPGAQFQSLFGGSLLINEPGDILFQVALADGRVGVFLAKAPLPPVPTLGIPGLALLVLGIVAGGVATAVRSTERRRR